MAKRISLNRRSLYIRIDDEKVRHFGSVSGEIVLNTPKSAHLERGRYTSPGAAGLEARPDTNGSPFWQRCLSPGQAYALACDTLFT